MDKGSSFYLTDKFLEEYKIKDPQWGPLGELVYFRTYSRIKDDGTKEQWWETVKRVVEGVYTIQKRYCEKLRLPWNAHKAQKSAQTMFEKIFTFKFLPPGRGLWAMNIPFIEEKGSACLQNCAFISSSEITTRGSFVFGWAMDALMLGVGVAFDTKGAGKLVIKEPKPANGLIYKIPDTREGWVESVQLLIDAYLYGKQIPTYEYDLIRPYGAPIKGFGGLASGPGPLKELHESIDKLLATRVGEAISSVDIVDLMNMIGVCVVAGNVRRSAELSLGSAEDTEYINMKDYNLYPQEVKDRRWASNNSVIAEVGKTDYNKFVEAIALNGEPGFVWLENMKKFGRMADPADYKDKYVGGTNPCFTGDTIIAVADGRNGISIKQLAEESNGKIAFPVYSAKYSTYANQFGETDKFMTWKVEVKKAIAFKTGTKEVVEIVLSDGSSFKSTPDHKLATKDGRWIEAKDSEGEELAKFYSFSNKNTNKSYRTINSKTNGYARQYRYVYEYFKGHTDNTVDHIDNNCLNDNIENLRELSKEEHDKHSGIKKNGDNNPIHRMNADLRRWINRKRNINANATKYNWPEDRRLKAMEKFLEENPAPDQKEDVNIYLNEKVFVEEVIWNEEVEDVYDLTVEDNHNFYIITKTDDEKYLNSSGVLVHNCAEMQLESTELCTLVETFPSRHETKEEYLETLKYAYLYGKTITLVPTHWPETNAVMMKNRRIGTSMSGIIDAFVKHGRRNLLNWADVGYKFIRELDEEYSNWLAVPKSIRVTTVKPSGSVSTLPGVSPGIHYQHSEYYIRRIRIDKNSEICKAFENAGYPVEDSVYGTEESRKTTSVISIPIKEEQFDKKKEDVSIWEQVKNAVDLQRFWSDNSVSITVTFKKEEKDQIVPVLEAFEDQLKSISFLPISEHGYEQAPYEEITKEEYERISKKLKKVDYTEVLTPPIGEKYCTTDKCEI